jgi:Bacterial regulatory protein, arsR family./Nucleotidyltransferase domain.
MFNFMKFNKPLDDILGQKSKIKILRYLVNYKKEMGVRELAKEIGLVPANASVALKELEKEGILLKKKIGRSLIFSLNAGNFLAAALVVPLFEKEHKIKRELFKIISSRVKFPYETIVLFGSVAKKSERADSDIDLAVIIGDKDRVTEVEERILSINPEISEKFGNSIAPIVFKKKDFIKKIKGGDVLASNIARDGEVVSGKLISELL